MVLYFYLGDSFVVKQIKKQANRIDAEHIANQMQLFLASAHARG